MPDSTIDTPNKVQGIKIAVPAEEAKYFENAETFWNEKKVFVLYDMRNVFLTLRNNLSVDRTLTPSTPNSDEVSDWNGIQLKILGTPGPISRAFMIAA